MAETFGFEYRRCSSNGQVEDAVKWLVNSKCRVLLEIDQKFDDPVTPKVMSRLDENGKMLTPALQDMYPFLSAAEIEELMFKNKNNTFL